NVSQVARAIMAQPGGVNRSFAITNLSTQAEQYQMTITAQGDDTGWVTPIEPGVSLDPAGGTNASQNISISFRISDESGATSPLTFRLLLVRVTGGANEPQNNTTFDLTFVLQE
ncbi:MAG: hypothetical protein O7G88_18395, partial [bacterium]|nr:hypothetical protein [bacterium]